MAAGGAPAAHSDGGARAPLSSTHATVRVMVPGSSHAVALHALQAPTAHENRRQGASAQGRDVGAGGGVPGAQELFSHAARLDAVPPPHAAVQSAQGPKFQGAAPGAQAASPHTPNAGTVIASGQV